MLQVSKMSFYTCFNIDAVARETIILILYFLLCLYFSGDTFGIPDSIMGLTFLAAGMSVPEAVSSVIVANQGMIYKDDEKL